MTTPRPGRPADEELSARILEAGTELLTTRGYAQLRLEHVARAAGCGKTAIYRRYPDKAALVVAILNAHVRLGNLPDTGSVRTDLLEHALQNHRNQADERDGGHGLRAMFEPEVFPAMWEAFFRARREQGLEIIARGVARGELPADTHAGLLLDTIAGLTLYRRSVKGAPITSQQYAAVIDALVALPPRHAATKSANDTDLTAAAIAC